MSVVSDFLAFVAGTPALVIPMVTALVIFLTSDWRVSLSALLIQYSLVGLALTRSIRLEVALVKVLVGALAVFILLLSAQRMRPTEEEREVQEVGPQFLGLRLGWLRAPLGWPLRLLALLLVALGLIRLFQGYSLTIVPMDVALVACWLAGTGLLGLALGGDPVRVAAAALTILTGFDLVYSRLEPSLAVVGFLGALSLLAALTFSYLAVVRALDLGAPGLGRGQAPGQSPGQASEPGAGRP